MEIDDKTYYKLAEGTPHERFVPPFRRGVELGAEYDTTFSALMHLFQIVQKTTHGRIHNHVVLGPAGPGQAAQQLSGLGTLISAIWILWSYASHDVSRLRAELAETKAELQKLRSDVDHLVSLAGADARESSP